MGLIKGEKTVFLLRLQWVAGIFNSCIVLLLPGYFFAHANISLFIALCSISGLISTEYLLRSKRLTGNQSQYLICSLNSLFAILSSRHGFGQLNLWIGPMNVFMGSFLAAVEHRFDLSGRCLQKGRSQCAILSSKLSRLPRLWLSLTEYRRTKKVAFEPREMQDSRMMRRATSVTYTSIGLQIFFLLSIPGCILWVPHSDLMDWSIQRLYVDLGRYPSVVGDRVRDLRRPEHHFRAYDLKEKTPLYCSYYEGFYGYSYVSCTYVEGESAYVESMDEESCKLFRGLDNSSCKPKRERISLGEVIDEKTMAREVAREQYIRYSKNILTIVLISSAFGSPIAIPILRWLQLRSVRPKKEPPRL